MCPDISSRTQKTVENPELKAAQLRHAYIVVLMPFLGCLLAIALLLLGHLPGASEISVFIAMFFISSLGMTVGFHRYFTHRSFETSTPMRILFCIIGSMAGQGPLTYWVALHRRHHENSDQPGDPHSPHLQPGNRFKLLRGLWHAHIGWTTSHEIPSTIHYAPDLLRDKTISKISRLYFTWLFLGFVIPAAICGGLTQSWTGAFYGFLWGGLVRLFLVENLVWVITSIAHVFGRRPFHSHDMSTNNIWFAIPTLGESWHNNHHAFSHSAIFSLEWWQLDIGGIVIRALEKMGAVWNVKMPTPRLIAAKRAS